MNQNDPPTEHILACLSSSPSNAKIVRTAATMAKAFGGTFTALYVRTPDSDQMGKEDCRRLQQHIRMAEQAGAFRSRSQSLPASPALQKSCWGAPAYIAAISGVDRH
mgnify:CR=1 FL=1